MIKLHKNTQHRRIFFCEIVNFFFPIAIRTISRFKFIAASFALQTETALETYKYEILFQINR